MLFEFCTDLWCQATGVCRLMSVFVLFRPMFKSMNDLGRFKYIMTSLNILCISFGLEK